MKSQTYDIVMNIFINLNDMIR